MLSDPLGHNLNSPVTKQTNPFTLLHPPMPCFWPWSGGGVGLERIGKGGAHSLIPEISPKLFLLHTNNTAYCLARTVWIGAWLTVDELWHPLGELLLKKL